MGIFLRLFVLLEEDCHKLDCRAVVLDGVSVISYDNYCAALVTKRELMDEMVSLKDTIQCFEQHVVYMLSYGEEEMDAAVELMKLEIEGKKQRLNVVGEEIDKLEVTLKVDFKKEDGPFVKALDNALASFHVKRQAYYSGTFVGNHVHRALKKCHNIYDKNIVSDEEIEQLEDSIGAFMAFYRKNFATHSVLPKMHFLEVHVVPYLKQWHMGFEFLGEQGVESIHHYFNDLERTYCGAKLLLHPCKGIMASLTKCPMMGHERNLLTGVSHQEAGIEMSSVKVYAARLALQLQCSKSKAITSIYERLNLTLVRCNARALLSCARFQHSGSQG
eukprot:Em0008g298a